jgi:hypothetical protein
MRKYNRLQILTANVPYTAMVLLGAATIACAYGFTGLASLAAAGYVVYGAAGTLWIMAFVCRCCAFYATDGCPCGYGLLAARIFGGADQAAVDGVCPASRFKRHILVIVPLWFIPAVCAAATLWSSRSWPLMVLLAAFVVNSFLLLPLLSRRHGCAERPKVDLPGMDTEASQLLRSHLDICCRASECGRLCPHLVKSPGVALVKCWVEGQPIVGLYEVLGDPDWHCPQKRF